jgi:hypothetical protein
VISHREGAKDAKNLGELQLDRLERICRIDGTNRVSGGEKSTNYLNEIRGEEGAARA